jgi:uncharacterized UBP type Zn finger protein
MISGRPMAQGRLAVSLNGSAPHCEHIDGLKPVTPKWDGCRDCQARGNRWVTLMLCLSCGWVACSDDSPGRHAKAHYEETDHPVAVSLENGSRHRWCYVHQRLV